MTGPEGRKDLAGVTPVEDSGKIPGDGSTSEFEAQLARALRRVEVPEGFLASLMERAEKGDAPAGGHVPARSPGRGVSRVLAMPRRAWLGWASGAIAATLVAGLFVGQRVHEQHERRVEAEREFETATRITDEALERTRQQLAEKGIRLSGE